MRILLRDEGFVRAPRRDVHAYLVDVPGYGAWWPGVVSRPTSAGAVLVLRPPRRWARPQRLWISDVEERPDVGMTWCVAGDVAGEGEWYLLDEADGVRVHHLLRGTTRARGWRRRVADHRATVRAGMRALKGLLESGRSVGEEPTAWLRGVQARAMVATGRSGGEAD